MSTREPYEIPSPAIVALWWRRHHLPKILAEAERARQAQQGPIPVSAIRKRPWYQRVLDALTRPEAKQ